MLAGRPWSATCSVTTAQAVTRKMSDPILNVLFLCTGNSARSILAEAILERIGQGRFKAFSAGSHPAGEVNPHAIKLLQRLNYPTAGLRSKSWDELADDDAPPMDFVITVCDSAAGEACPLWPGQPVIAHWGLPDPAAVQGSDTEKSLAFADVYRELNTRLERFVSLPMDSLDRMARQRRMDELGTRQARPA